MEERMLCFFFADLEQAARKINGSGARTINSRFCYGLEFFNL
jgi:hypothetical protein